jgi:hypothetical protein
MWTEQLIPLQKRVHCASGKRGMGFSHTSLVIYIRQPHQPKIGQLKMHNMAMHQHTSATSKLVSRDLSL